MKKTDLRDGVIIFISLILFFPSQLLLPHWLYRINPDFSINAVSIIGFTTIGLYFGFVARIMGFVENKITFRISQFSFNNIVRFFKSWWFVYPIMLLILISDTVKYYSINRYFDWSSFAWDVVYIITLGISCILGVNLGFLVMKKKPDSPEAPGEDLLDKIHAG